MNGESANRFISALIKSLQTLCQGYVEFNDGIEIIGHLYLNIDSGCSFDYILKEKVCKSAENSTVFVSKSYAAQSPSGELVTRKEKSHSLVPDFEDPSLGTSRLQSAITSISNVLSGTQNQKPRLLSLDQATHGKRKREHNGSYSSMQPPYKYANLQSSSSSSAYFNNSSKPVERNHSEHFSSSSHAEFFGGGGDSNQSSGMGPDDEDDLDLDVTFVKAEYSEGQRYSSQRGVSAVAASRLSQDPASSQSTSLHEQSGLSGQLNYPSTSGVGQQAPQQFTSGTATDLPAIGQAFQDTGQLDLATAQHSMQGPPNPRSREQGEQSVLSSPSFTAPRGPAKFFRCPVCSIIIRHKNNIKRHMRRHNDPAANDNVDVHKTWGQHFVPAPLSTHTQDGRPIRTYSCPMCGLQISHRKNIRRHMRKHTGEMFFCDLCDWRGTCRWKMQKHREKKHGILPPLALTPSEQQIACSSS